MPRLGFEPPSRNISELSGLSNVLDGWSKRRRVASEFGVWSWWPGRSEVPFRLSSTASIFCRLAEVYHSIYSALLLNSHPPAPPFCQNKHRFPPIKLSPQMHHPHSSCNHHTEPPGETAENPLFLAAAT